MKIKSFLGKTDNCIKCRKSFSTTSFEQTLCENCRPVTTVGSGGNGGNEKTTCNKTIIYDGSVWEERNRLRKENRKIAEELLRLRAGGGGGSQSGGGTTNPGCHGDVISIEDGILYVVAGHGKTSSAKEIDENPFISEESDEFNSTLVNYCMSKKKLIEILESYDGIEFVAGNIKIFIKGIKPEDVLITVIGGGGKE